MNTIDVIILSNTIDPSYFNMLENCVNSICKNNVKTNIVIVETNSKLKNKHIPLNVNFVFPEEPFNYNRFLNYGIKHCTSNTILISNNDIIYDNNCLDLLYNGLNHYDSVSPWDKGKHPQIFKEDQNYIEGNEVGKHVIGYSIMFKKEILNKIGTFDENFKFWYQDNDYCSLLRKHNLKHALVTNAKCLHLGCQSHKLLTKEELIENTNNAIKVLYNKWGK